MTIEVTHDDRVVVVTLNRPARRNAVDHPTLLELLEVQATIASQAPETIRAVVLTGTPPAFSAGADLNGVEAGQFQADLAAVLHGFCRLPVAVIAAIDGPALGAGAQLAVATDLRVATPSSIVGVPAAKLGLVVDHWTIRRLSSEFSPPIARAMLMAAQTYTGEQLHATGGVHLLGGLDDAIAWAHELASLAPLTIAGHKLGLESTSGEPGADQDFEAARRAAWASADAEEGRSAFLEKRPARFTGH